MEGICDYIFESGQLKHVKRSGWWVAGIRDPESVAGHTYRTAVIAFILARLEGADADRLCSAAVFHDVHESRTLDLHKISAAYSTTDYKKAEEGQLSMLPKNISRDMKKLLNLSGKEGYILRDADLLECAFQAKEYLENGHPACTEWIVNISKKLRTKSAKRLLATMRKTRSSKWWRGLKKL